MSDLAYDIAALSPIKTLCFLIFFTALSFNVVRSFHNWAFYKEGILWHLLMTITWLSIVVLFVISLPVMFACANVILEDLFF